MATCISAVRSTECAYALASINLCLCTLESDSEISFCGAIEMAGIITVKLSLLKNGMEELCAKSPIYIQGAL